MISLMFYAYGKKSVVTELTCLYPVYVLWFCFCCCCCFLDAFKIFSLLFFHFELFGCAMSKHYCLWIFPVWDLLSSEICTMYVFNQILAVWDVISSNAFFKPQSFSVFLASPLHMFQSALSYRFLGLHLYIFKIFFLLVAQIL